MIRIANSLNLNSLNLKSGMAQNNGLVYKEKQVDIEI